MKELVISLRLWARLVTCFVLRHEILITVIVARLLGHGEITYSSTRVLFLAL